MYCYLIESGRWENGVGSAFITTTHVVTAYSAEDALTQFRVNNGGKVFRLSAVVDDEPASLPEQETP